MEPIDALQLVGAHVGQVARGVADDQLEKPGLELEAGLGVEEVESHGGPPAAGPKEEVLGGGRPRGVEHGEHVAADGGGLGAVVVLVVAEDPVNEGSKPELLAGGSGCGTEDLQIAFLLGEPALEELGEMLRGAGLVAGRSRLLSALLVLVGGAHGALERRRSKEGTPERLGSYIEGGPCRFVLWGPEGASAGCFGSLGGALHPWRERKKTRIVFC